LEENVQPIIERLAKNNIWLFPDIANVDYKDTYTDPILQQIKQLSRTHTVILLAGVLNERKNVFTFLRAAEIARQKKLPWIFVVAGYTNKYFWDKEENYNRFMLELNAGHSNLFSKTDGIADGTPFNSYIANCHIMVAAYHKFYYSSNIITKIAHFHKPVVVTQNCLMALRVHKYQLGKAIDDASANELVDAISSLDGYSQNANFIDGCNRYYSLHTIQKLQQALMHITKQ
jgi:glycosyltransferase involved in cell wall biosynthesis